MRTKPITNATDDLPYEKFIKKGSESLSDAELLAIIIRTGTKEEGAVELAKRALSVQSRCSSLLNLHQVSLKDLMSIKGIGQVKAVKIKCISELSNRLAKERAYYELQFTNPGSVANYYMEQLRHLKREQTLLVMLDNKSHFLGDFILSQGTVNASLMSPREIFLCALKNEAVYILLLHNHPSGDPTPSGQDIKITKQIKEISDLIEIPLIDHIIIGDNNYSSMKELRIL